MADSVDSEFPNLYELIFTVPLYKSFEITESEVEAVKHLINYKQNFKTDAFCVYCGESSIFVPRESGSGRSISIMQSIYPQILPVELLCVRELKL